jgi:hypothetical protein
VILAEKLKGLVRRRYAIVGEGADSLLPCRHAILMVRAVKMLWNSMHPFRYDYIFDTTISVQPCGAATASQDAYITPIKAESTSERPMAFKPNYGRDRAERARASRTRSEEKQLKKDEKTALRKARRAEMNPAPDDTNPPQDETQN